MTAKNAADVADGSKTALMAPKRHFRSGPNRLGWSGSCQSGSGGYYMALFSHHVEHRLHRIYHPWIATNLFKEHKCYTCVGATPACRDLRRDDGAQVSAGDVVHDLSCPVVGKKSEQLEPHMQAIIVGMLRVIGGGFLGLAATVAWLTMLYSKARAGHHGRLRQSNVTHPRLFWQF